MVGQEERRFTTVNVRARFDVLITVDRSLRHQQNLQSAGIALIVLVAASNRLSDLVPLMPSVQAALGSVRPGDVEEIAG